MVDDFERVTSELVQSDHESSVLAKVMDQMPVLDSPRCLADGIGLNVVCEDETVMKRLLDALGAMR